MSLSPTTRSIPSRSAAGTVRRRRSRGGLGDAAGAVIRFPPRRGTDVHHDEGPRPSRAGSPNGDRASSRRAPRRVGNGIGASRPCVGPVARIARVSIDRKPMRKRRDGRSGSSRRSLAKECRRDGTSPGGDVSSHIERMSSDAGWGPTFSPDRDAPSVSDVGLPRSRSAPRLPCGPSRGRSGARRGLSDAPTPLGGRLTGVESGPNADTDGHVPTEIADRGYIVRTGP